MYCFWGRSRAGVVTMKEFKWSMGLLKWLDRFLTNEIEAQNRFLRGRRRKIRILRPTKEITSHMGLSPGHRHRYQKCCHRYSVIRILSPMTEKITDGLRVLSPIWECFRHRHKLLFHHCHWCLGIASFFAVADFIAVAGSPAVEGLPAVADLPAVSDCPGCTCFLSVAQSWASLTLQASLLLHASISCKGLSQF